MTAAPSIHVVMALHRPDDGFLAAQLASLGGQSLRPERLVAVIADDLDATEARIRTLAKEAGLSLDVLRPGGPLDAVRAFEAGLGHALPGCGAGDLIALCDQDDVWRADRLARGADEIARSGAVLVHSDARVIDAGGEVTHQSLFQLETRHRDPGLRGLLYRNTVTGMTSLMRAEVLRLALPFPEQHGVHFYHDLWLALVASAMGEVRLIPEPLVDYRAHGANALGPVTAEVRAARRLPPGMAWLHREAGSYGIARYLAHVLIDRLEEGAGDGRLSRELLDSARPRLAPFLGRSGAPGAHLADTLRGAAAGRRQMAQAGIGFAVAALARGTWAWKRAVTHGRPAALSRFDRHLYGRAPGLYPPMPEHAGAEDGAPASAPGAPDIRMAARWHPAFTAARPALVVLVPTLNPAEVFAGITTALRFGTEMAARGHEVRIIATDIPIRAPEVSRGAIVGGLAPEVAARITIHDGSDAGALPAHRDDRFLVSAWWSAHVAAGLIRDHGYREARFTYLIQDFEPAFYPWGDDHAAALASYALDFDPIFNSSLIRDYFAAQGHGFASLAPAMHPALDLAPLAALESAREGPRVLLFYGRPSVDRNMFGLGVAALRRFVAAEGIDPGALRILSVGELHDPVDLGRGHRLESRGKLPWSTYLDLMSRADLGLSLMLSPHPSHPPLEMAAAGLRVVTNGFAGKDLSRVSPAILSAPPEAGALADALAAAWRMAPVTAQERRLDLTVLGDAPEAAMDALSAVLETHKSAEPPRRIILHVGAPNCGSTYVQRLMMANRASLSRRGIAYPAPAPGHPGNAGGLRALDRAGIEAMFAGGAGEVVLSHEDLFTRPADGRDFAALCGEIGVTLHVLAFLRPFPQMVFADYSQRMKQFFDRFVETRLPYDGKDFETLARGRARALAPVQALKGWAGLADTLTLARSADIRPTLERLLGEGAIETWDLPEAQVNKSLRVEDCDRLAEAIRDPEMTPEALRDMLARASRDAGRADAGRTAERRALVDEIFALHRAGLQREFGFDPGR